MTTPIAPIGSIAAFVPFVAPIGPASAAASAGSAAGVGSAAHAGAAHAVTGADTASGVNFSAALADGFDAVQAAQTNANTLAVKAATGELVDPAQLTIATTKAQLMTQMATTIQSKAVNAFNTIMSMQA